MRKKFISILLSTVITNITATSNVAELPLYGKERENPEINIIEGSPVKYNSGGNPNWYKKMLDGFWGRYDSEIGANFEEGEYQIKGACIVSGTGSFLGTRTVIEKIIS